MGLRASVEKVIGVSRFFHVINPIYYPADLLWLPGACVGVLASDGHPTVPGSG